MQRYGIGDQELKLAKLLWANEGIGSGAVVTLCKEEFGWAKSTTYTMLRRICEHGLFQNQNSIVTALLSEEQYLARTAKEFLSNKFNGSLTSFFSIYTKHNTLSSKEAKTCRTYFLKIVLLFSLSPVLISDKRSPFDG